MLPDCQLFVSAGCPLCEQAEAELMLLVERGLLVELIDVGDSPVLHDRYRMRVPVLRRIDTGIELDWPFEPEDIAGFLAYAPRSP
jgi:hypothetical protein